MKIAFDLNGVVRDIFLKTEQIYTKFYLEDVESEISSEYDESKELDELESLDDLIKEANAERDGEVDDDSSDDSDISNDNDNKEQNLNDEDLDSDDKNDEENLNEDLTEDKDSEEKNEDDELENTIDDNTPSFTPIETEVGGHKITINSQEELDAILKKGAESFSQNKEKTKEELALEQSGLSAEDIALFIDAKNGDKNALAKIATQGKIDLLDVDENDADNYSQAFQVKEATDIERVAQSIVDNTELHNEFKNLTSGLPQSFMTAITSNAQDLQTFSEHVRSGLAREIIPEAIKLTYQGMDFSQAYVNVGTRIMSDRSQEQEQPKAQSVSNDRNISDREKDLRKKAREVPTSSQTTNQGLTEDDIWNMTDEEFAEYTAKGEQG